MSFRWSQREEYEKGREDEHYGRRDWDRDRWSHDPKDEAYFEGQRDERRHQERLEEERREQEAYERRCRERMDEERQREEQYEYDRQCAEMPPQQQPEPVQEDPR